MGCCTCTTYVQLAARGHLCSTINTSKCRSALHTTVCCPFNSLLPKQGQAGVPGMPGVQRQGQAGVSRQLSSHSLQYSVLVCQHMRAAVHTCGCCSKASASAAALRFDCCTLSARVLMPRCSRKQACGSKLPPRWLAMPRILHKQTQVVRWLETQLMQQQSATPDSKYSTHISSLDISSVLLQGDALKSWPM